jgi:recombination protein RecA
MAKKAASTEEYLSADFFIENAPEIISFNPAVDTILGGGLRAGSLNIIGGPPGLGKTSCALAFARNAQKLGYITVYDAIEERLEGSLLQAIEGLDTSSDMLKIICSTPGNILTAEQHLQKSEKALIDFPGCVLINDSFSDLSSSDEKTKEYGQGFNVSARKLEAEYCRRIGPILRVNKNIVIAISQTSTPMGYAGTNDIISRKANYKCNVKLRCAKAKDFEIMSGDQQIGHRISWELLKNSYGPPSGKVISHLRYGTGPDDLADLLGLATDLAIIDKGGAGWYTLPNDKKAQGFDNLYNEVKQDQELLKSIKKSVMEMIK